MNREIYDLINKYEKIVIARHIGGDPDALGSTFALKEIINANFENKEVIVVGASIAKFRMFGMHDKMDELFYDGLLIAVDIPDIKRLDGVDFYKFKNVIKFDHHPEIDKFSDYEIIDEKASSASEVIANWCYSLGLKIPKIAAENIFMGIVADTNRFLFQCTTSNTFRVVQRLINENNIDISELYERLYRRNMTEVRLQGFISLNMKITKDGVGYIKITDSDLKAFAFDSASIGSIMNEFNYIDGLIAWAIFTEDIKQNVIRTSARSRGPIINRLFEQYNGGGHPLACGAKLKSFEEADEIIDKLNEICKEYKEEMYN